MSSKASAYAKELIVCPNGELVSRGEKLVLIVLADAHQVRKERFTYPSIDAIAPEALCDRRTCQRHMAGLERKGVILRLRPPNQGRGMQVFYFFPALDEIPEGWQDAALFCGHEIGGKGGKRAAEGRQKGGNLFAPPVGRAQERKQQLKQKQVQPPYPPQAGESGAQQIPIDVKAYEAAIDQVMRGCGFTARRMRAVIDEVLRLEIADADGPPVMALAAAMVAMVEAWEDFTSQGMRLRFKWGARRFFQEGYWRERESWPWDNEILKQERLQAGARVGSR